MNDNKLYILFESDHWDSPISGLGRYNGQLVWYNMCDEFEADWQTGERLDHAEVMRRARMEDDILDQYTDEEIDSDEVTEQLLPYEFYTTRIYAIHQLSTLDKILAKIRTWTFEVMVGIHWSWHRAPDGSNRGSFRMGRWLGLGKPLFWIYYKYLPYLFPRRDLTHNQIIGYARWCTDTVYGEPNNE